MKWRIFSRGCVVGAFLLLLVAPAFPQGQKEGGKKGGGKTQYDFKVIFEGDFTLLAETANGDPWELTSGTGGHGNIGASPTRPGPVPLYSERIAEIGDAVCPCDENSLCPPVLPESGNCYERLVSAGNLSAERLRFQNSEDPNLGTNVVMSTQFFVTDMMDGIEYKYTLHPFGSADLVNHPWDPKDPEFCVPINFEFVRIWQNLPQIKRGKKICSETFFATCEAETTDLPLQQLGTFRAVIWRAEAGLSPPASCSF